MTFVFQYQNQKLTFILQFDWEEKVFSKSVHIKQQELFSFSYTLIFKDQRQAFLYASKEVYRAEFFGPIAKISQHKLVTKMINILSEQEISNTAELQQLLLNTSNSGACLLEVHEHPDQPETLKALADCTNNEKINKIKQNISECVIIQNQSSVLIQLRQIYHRQFNQRMTLNILYKQQDTKRANLEKYHIDPVKEELRTFLFVLQLVFEMIVIPQIKFQLIEIIHDILATYLGTVSGIVRTIVCCIWIFWRILRRDRDWKQYLMHESSFTELDLMMIDMDGGPIYAFPEQNSLDDKNL